MKTNQGLPYCVSFDTKEMPGKVVGVRVQLDKMVLADDTSVRVDLADHPLYRHLHDYCAKNPPTIRGVAEGKRHG